MKPFASLALFLTVGLMPIALQANPFRTHFVCVPPIAANAPELEFFIRDEGQCADNETYMEVKSGGDGSILVMPAKDSLTPEEQRDLDRYRKFFGGTPPKDGSE